MIGRSAALAFALGASALAPAPAAAQGPPAPGAAFVTVVQTVHIDREPAAVWRKVGGYCDIGAWLKTTCVYTTGDGGIGTNRLIAGRINEVMVARTSTSYTYAQPMAPDLYHGTFEVLPDGSGSKIVYTLFYDVASKGDAKARADDQARRAALFGGVLKSIKAIAEAP